MTDGSDRAMTDSGQSDILPSETLRQAVERQAGADAARIALACIDSPRGRSIIEKAIHDQACGCTEPWPTRADYGAMSRAICKGLLG